MYIYIYLYLCEASPEFETRALDTLTGMLLWALPLPDSKPIEFAKNLQGILSTGIATQICILQVECPD